MICLWRPFVDVRSPFFVSWWCRRIVNWPVWTRRVRSMRRRKFTVHLRDAGSLLFPCPPTQNENFQLPVLPVALVSDPIGRRGVVSIGSGSMDPIGVGPRSLGGEGALRVGRQGSLCGIADWGLRLPPLETKPFEPFEPCPSRVPTCACV